MITITPPDELENVFKSNFKLFGDGDSSVVLADNENLGIQIKMSKVNDLPYIYVEVDGDMEYETETISIEDAIDEYSYLLGVYIDEGGFETDSESDEYERENALESDYDFDAQIRDMIYDLFGLMLGESPAKYDVDDQDLDDFECISYRYLEDFIIPKKK